MASELEEGLIVLEDSGTDWRHRLNGRPVHSGDFLQLQTPLGWMTARYEMSDFLRREAVLYSGGGAWKLDPEGMVLCWPAERQ